MLSRHRLDPAHGPTFPAFALIVQGTGQGQKNLLDGVGFLDIIPGSIADGQFGSVRIALAGDDNHRWSNLLGNHARQHGQSVAIGQAHIQNTTS